MFAVVLSIDGNNCLLKNIDLLVLSNRWDLHLKLYHRFLLRTEMTLPYNEIK